MIFFQISPEHVLDAVGGIKNAGAEALPGFFQRIEEHALAIVVIGVALRQKCLIVKHSLVERPGIFGKPQGGIRAEQAWPDRWNKLPGARPADPACLDRCSPA